MKNDTTEETIGDDCPQCDNSGRTMPDGDQREWCDREPNSKFNIANRIMKTDKSMEAVMASMAQELAGKSLYDGFCKSQLNPPLWNQLSESERGRWSSLVTPENAMKNAKIHISRSKNQS